MAVGRIKKAIDFIVRHSSAKGKLRLLKIGKYTCESVRKTEGSFAYDLQRRMDPNLFLPPEPPVVGEKQKHMADLAAKKGKTRVPLLYPSGTSWSLMGTVYDALCADDRYEVCVVVENYPKYIAIMLQHDCDYITLDEYDIKEDRPDVFVVTTYSSTSPRLNFEGVTEYAGHILSLFPNVVINEPDMDEHWDFVNRAYSHITPETFLFDSLPYEYSKGYVPETRVKHMGCPLFDELYEKMQAPVSYEGEWAKLEGKKVFLWGTDHGINEYHSINALSFDLYLADMFAFFAARPELGLIIRLHPFLLREIRENGAIWSESDYERVRAYCRRSPNIVWDDTPDYAQAFNISDAMMIDVNCGFTISYLCTGKPICRLTRGEGEAALIHPELKDCYDYAKSFADCERFMNGVAAGSDPLKEKREAAFKRAILHFDGKNGLRVKEHIDHICFEKGEEK